MKNSKKKESQKSFKTRNKSAPSVAFVSREKKKKNAFVDAVFFADDDDDDADAFEIVFLGAVLFLLLFFFFVLFFSRRIRSEAFSNANTFFVFFSGCSCLRFE